MSKYVLDNEWGTKYPSFKKSNFKCPCGKCNGYGNGIATTLVKILQDLRNKYGKPITISSGYRCPSHNKKVGGTTNSKHTQGLAADFYMSGFNSQSTRVNVINELKKTPYYRYAYCNVNGNYPNMGNVVHIDTKLIDPDNKGNKIEVDGVWGSTTTKKAQEVFKTTIDGKVSNQYNSYKSKNPGLSSTTFEWEKNPNKNGSSLIKAIQKKLGIKQDGFIGTNTIKSMQKWLGTPQDGCVSKPSSMVKAFQKWLNEQ